MLCLFVHKSSFGGLLICFGGGLVDIVTQVLPWHIVMVEPVMVPVQPPVHVMVPSGLTTMSANANVENKTVQ